MAQHRGPVRYNENVWKLGSSASLNALDRALMKDKEEGLSESLPVQLFEGIFINGNFTLHKVTLVSWERMRLGDFHPLQKEFDLDNNQRLNESVVLYKLIADIDFSSEFNKQKQLENQRRRRDCSPQTQVFHRCRHRSFRLEIAVSSLLDDVRYHYCGFPSVWSSHGRKGARELIVREPTGEGLSFLKRDLHATVIDTTLNFLLQYANLAS